MCCNVSETETIDAQRRMCGIWSLGGAAYSRRGPESPARICLHELRQGSTTGKPVTTARNFGVSIKRKMRCANRSGESKRFRCCRAGRDLSVAGSGYGQHLGRLLLDKMRGVPQTRQAPKKKRPQRRVD